MSDLIDREAVMEIILMPQSVSIIEQLEMLKKLPSAEPKRPKGKWIPHSEKSREYIGTSLVNVEYDYWFCDTCGYRVKNGQPIHNFCPNCGAKMEVSE